MALSCRVRVVPRAGVEPARSLSGKRRILSPLCLPISPPGPNVHCRRLGGRMCRTWDRRQGERSGGAWRSRTALDGFAIRCITALLTRQCRYKKRKPSFLLLQRPAWWTGCESGAGNGTGTRALSHCFPTTFSAAVIGEGLKYSLIFPPWRSTARPRCRQAFMTSPVAVRPTPGFTLARAPPPSAFTNSAIPITQGNGHCPPRVCNRARDLKPLHVLERRVRRQAPTL